MKRPKIPKITNPNAPQQAVSTATTNPSTMHSSPMQAMFAPLSAGLMSKRAGRRSLIGS